MTAAVETITIIVNGAKYTSGTVSSNAATVAVPYSLRGATITGYEAVAKDGTTIVPATATASASTDIPVSSTTATITVKNTETQAQIGSNVTLTISTVPVLVSEQYYRKTFIGNGNKTAMIAEAALGYFYIDASTGEVYVYDGATWNKVSGATICVTV
jgi:hypothetical protein